MMKGFFEIGGIFKTTDFCNAALQYADIFLRRKEARALPQSIQVETTTKCNLHCKMCEHTYLKQKLDDMGLEKFKKIIDKMPWLKDLNLTGIGEGLLNKDFLEMVKYAKGKGIRVWFNDNMTLLKGKKIDEVINANVDAIVVSLDGATKKTYEDIKRGSSFENVVANIKQINKRKKELGRKKPEVLLNVIMMRENLQELSQMPAFAKSLDIRGITFGRLLSFKENSASSLSLPELNGVYPKIKKAAKKFGIRAILPSLASNKWECSFPWTTFYVSSNGSVAPCCYVTQRGNRDILEKNSFGNIFAQDFSDIWNSQKYKAFRTAFGRGQVPDVCKPCYRFQRNEDLAIKQPLLNKATSFFSTIVLPTDYLKKGAGREGKKLRLGWCSVFPPTPNGSAAITYYFVKELLKRKDIETFAIPVNNRIDKSMFKGIKFSKPEDGSLDAIIFFCLGLGAYAEIFKSKTNSIVWQTIHYSPKDTKGERKLFDLLEKIPHLFLVCKWAQKAYIKFGKADTKYLPLAVDSGIFKPVEKKGFKVLFVNRAQYYKGIIPFLESIPMVLKKHPEIKFVLHSPIDETTDHLDEIKSLVRKTLRDYPYNFFHEQNWLDYDNIPEKYADASVLVFPSNNEGFGVPLIEAMSCEVPCIVADKPPMSEIVIDGKTGYCLPIKKGIEKNYHDWGFPAPEDIAEKINYLFEHPKERQRMGANGRNHVKKNYELKKIVDKIIEYSKKTSGKKWAIFS